MSVQRWRDFNLPHINTSNHQNVNEVFISFTFDCSSFQNKGAAGSSVSLRKVQNRVKWPRSVLVAATKNRSSPVSSTERCFSASCRISLASETLDHVAHHGTSRYRLQQLQNTSIQHGGAELGRSESDRKSETRYFYPGVLIKLESNKDQRRRSHQSHRSFWSAATFGSIQNLRTLSGSGLLSVPAVRT